MTAHVRSSAWTAWASIPWPPAPRRRPSPPPLTFEPLARAGLALTDVDKYAPELHNAEIPLPAGAGNVPEANYKMIAALAVMKGQLAREDLGRFVAERGMPGFVATQGHIPPASPMWAMPWKPSGPVRCAGP